MDSDILMDILERKAALLARPGQDWTESVAAAAAALVAGVDGRWAPGGVWQLRAGLAQASAILGTSPPRLTGLACPVPNS